MSDVPRWCSPRLWDIVVAVGLLACAAILSIPQPPPQYLPALAVLAAFGLYYALLGRRALAAEASWPGVEARPPLPAWLLLLNAAALVLLVGVGCVFAGGMASLQMLAYPLCWMTLPERWRIPVNASIAGAIAAGYALRALVAAESLDELASTALIGAVVAGISLAFSLAMGLWISGVVDYGQERARLLAELTAAQEAAAQASRVAGVAQERARLARELHDTVTQDLTGLVMLAERAGQQLRGAQPGLAEQTLLAIETVGRESLAQARALVAATQPEHLASGLAQSLRRVAERYEQESGARVELCVALPTLDREQEVVLLRCAQEGIANVRKHAGAGRVWLTALIREDRAEGGELVLTVADDGRGPVAARTVPAGDRPALPEARYDGGFGLPGMSERLAVFGGSVALAERPGGGAVLTVRMPAARAAALSGARP